MILSLNNILLGIAILLMVISFILISKAEKKN